MVAYHSLFYFLQAHLIAFNFESYVPTHLPNGDPVLIKIEKEFTNFINLSHKRVCITHV